MKEYFYRKSVDHLPQLPGVYFFFDRKGKIIYVGKAINLQRRVSSYFQKTHQDLKTQNLAKSIKRIKIIPVLNEFEALILESELIKKHKPKYNLVSKDDKHYIYITVTDENFPRVLLSRGKGNFGPFPSSKTARDILSLIRSIIPYCTQSLAVKSPCFYSHINLCNPCPGYIRQSTGKEYDGLFRSYQQNIKRVRILLSGKIGKLKSLLESEMKTLVKKQKFEEAAQFRDKIENLDFLVNNYHSADVYIDNPDLATQSSKKEHKELFDILSKFYTQLKLPKKIECYDISNVNGKNAVGSMVTFVDGQPSKQLYRRFRIRSLDTPNDFSMLKEVFSRRLKHKEWTYPELIVVDGGVPQLSAMMKVKDMFSLDIPIIGLAKHFDEIVVWDGNSYTNIRLPRNSSGLHLVQRLRDEAHRFAHRYYETLASKSIILSQ